MVSCEFCHNFLLFFRLEADFLSQIVQKRGPRLSIPFFLVLGIIFAAIMVKTRQKKTPVAAGRVCNFVQNLSEKKKEKSFNY